ncbi:glutamic acid-rich protein-like isoform X3 [Wyeomyia smithii]|uniref:glutamic acid-rich protein-like isoform X3 n=1 Tax=Wyeomyia smithii TaxID=174621 RepID=UPI002467BB6C|nr:glutamic acid-rich protein-like isoform X3 [Wyeomyia smithii]
MVIKVYISGMSGSKEVKKRQQRVTMILDSKHISYNIIDITEPGQEAEKDFMQKNSEHNGATISDQNPRHPLPPQMFNDAEYCGDYDDFDLANEVDNLEVFLKLAAPKPPADSTESNVEANGKGEDKSDREEDEKEQHVEESSTDEPDQQQLALGEGNEPVEKGDESDRQLMDETVDSVSHDKVGEDPEATEAVIDDAESIHSDTKEVDAVVEQVEIDKEVVVVEQAEIVQKQLERVGSDDHMEVDEVGQTSAPQSSSKVSAGDSPGTDKEEDENLFSTTHDVETGQSDDVSESEDSSGEPSDSDDLDSVKEVISPTVQSGAELFSFMQDGTNQDDPSLDDGRIQKTLESKENFSGEPATEVDDDAEQRELLKAAAAMGKREDEEDANPEDVDLAEEEEVSGKLADADDPMLAEQEQEE